MSKFIFLGKNQYFEAIIQLRPFDEQVMKFIEEEISKKKGIFISKIEKLKTGIDIYVSDQRFTRNLGEKLKKKFKGELVNSRKIYGMDRLKMRSTYRATILFRIKNEQRDVC